jgi:hypothetical protein
VGNLLVDGVYAGHWKQGDQRIDVELDPTVMRHADEVAAETSRMAEMIWPDAEARVEVSPL